MRPTPAERRSRAAARRSSSSGCSGGWSPGSSLQSPGCPVPGRSRHRPTQCWVPSCPTTTQSPRPPRCCWSPTAAGNPATPPSHSTPLSAHKQRGGQLERVSIADLCWGVFVRQQAWRKSGDSPISLRLEKPAVIGACLGDLPRLGALDDQTLHPSPSDFSLWQTDSGNQDGFRARDALKNIIIIMI